MSKESALAQLTGQPVQANPSLISPMPTEVKAEGQPTSEGVELKKPLDSDRLAAIARNEAKLVKEREAFKKEKEQIQKEREEYTKVKSLWENFQKVRTENPREALKMAGFSDTEVFNILTDNQPKELSPEEKAQAIAQEEIKKFKESEEKARAEAQAKADQEAITKYRQRISNTIKTQAEKYEFINYNGAQGEDLVYETINEILLQDGENFDHAKAITEAADLVEAYYEDAYEAMKAIKKVQPKTDDTDQVKVEAPKIPMQKSKTLTNAATITSKTVSSPTRESREQKRERLINMVKQNGLTR